MITNTCQGCTVTVWPHLHGVEKAQFQSFLLHSNVNVNVEKFIFSWLSAKSTQNFIEVIR